MPYVVMIEIEEGELIELPEGSSFKTGDNPKYYNTRAEAEREAAKWNTGQVLFVVGG